MIEAFPYQADNLNLWDKFVDHNGKTLLNQEEYLKHRLNGVSKAKAKKAKLAKEKAGKGKLISKKQKKKIAEREAQEAKYQMAPLPE